MKPAPLSPSEVEVVTVTYGERWGLLRQVISAALSEGAGGVTVVDNAAAPGLAGRIAAEFDSRVQLIHHSTNLGSAGGFAAGMRAALTRTKRFICLLDDDNVLAPGCLASLLATYTAQDMPSAPAHSAVLAFRPEHYVAGSLAQQQRERSSYLGFHVADIGHKLLRHLGHRCAPQSQGGEVRWGPWGGLLFHRAVPESIGLPRADYVLYNDDIEWTLRLTDAGGRIVLDRQARIVDVDQSGHAAANYPNVFVALLTGSSDMRMYYEFRNRSHLEQLRNRRPDLVMRVNRLLFWLILQIYALALGRPQRLRLLKAARHDGESGRLGTCPAYPLPACNGEAA
ncbi:glycosyltransferase [Uliginosibacterium sp. 31-12]|uniref:glycosyltransferase n=1 Tax=Uliginosibacterium sp. 31-12 TaxID=3062781 RepID=UPI0026E2FC72|nr:glycosyltransferase [Uliginosibacterium sp. 31-12]MDO6387302.1 glycosyltransferase [Uliginosibacterium sp. 31-12]